MEINRKQADVIINTLKSVVQEDINFISKNGVIISSSNPSRVGDIHTGALIVVKTKEPLEIEYDGQYEGTLQGINLPVFNEQNLIAVVGITGDVDKIRQLSNIIVKMTEILIKEHLMNQQKEFKREKNRIIMDMITKDKFNPDVIMMKMDELGYDKVTHHHFVVCKLSEFDRQNIDLTNRIYNSFENRIHYFDLLVRDESKFLYLSQIKDKSLLYDKINGIKRHVEDKYNVKFTVGISETIHSADNLYAAYQQANMVIELEVYNGYGEIIAFDASSLEFFFQLIPVYLRQEFSNHVLKDTNKNEKRNMRLLLKAYVKHNGSLNACAKSLFIHKNTVQYRLNRIATRTGYNPRTLEHLIILYTALSLE